MSEYAQLYKSFNNKQEHSYFFNIAYLNYIRTGKTESFMILEVSSFTGSISIMRFPYKMRFPTEIVEFNRKLLC